VAKSYIYLMVSYSLTTSVARVISKTGVSYVTLVITDLTVLSIVSSEAFACVQNHNVFFVKRPSCNVTNQQQLHWAVHMMWFLLKPRSY